MYLDPRKCLHCKIAKDNEWTPFWNIQVTDMCRELESLLRRIISTLNLIKGTKRSTPQNKSMLCTHNELILSISIPFFLDHVMFIGQRSQFKQLLKITKLISDILWMAISVGLMKNTDYKMFILVYAIYAVVSWKRLAECVTMIWSKN